MLHSVILPFHSQFLLLPHNLPRKIVKKNSTPWPIEGRCWSARGQGKLKSMWWTSWLLHFWAQLSSISSAFNNCVFSYHNGVCRLHINTRRCVPHAQKCTTMCAAYTDMHNGVCRIRRYAHWSVAHKQKCTTACATYTEMHNGVCRVHRNARRCVPHAQKCTTVCDA